MAAVADPVTTPGRVAKREERRRGRLLLGVTPRAALGLIVATAAAVALLGALLAFMVDGDSFDSFGDALWWAVVTVGTVGYGDVVPTNGAGRVVAAVMILFTMALFPILTGVVTATLIDQGQREASADEERQAEERQGEVLEYLRSLDARLARLEDRAP
jgi:voltage-gated potassium channel